MAMGKKGSLASLTGRRRLNLTWTEPGSGVQKRPAERDMYTIFNISVLYTAYRRTEPRGFSVYVWSVERRRG